MNLSLRDRDLEVSNPLLFMPLLDYSSKLETSIHIDLGGRKTSLWYDIGLAVVYVFVFVGA